MPSGSTINFNSSFDITAGTFTVAGTLNLSSGTINMTPATYNVTGPTNLIASTYNLNKNSSTSNWTQSGGTLSGSGNLTVSSGLTYAWTGGSMGGTGTTTVASGGTLTINGNVILLRVLTNNGTVTQATGIFYFTNATFNNNAAFTAQPDSFLANNGGTNVFNNNASGTFTRNTGTGLYEIDIPFINTGTLTVSTGTAANQRRRIEHRDDHGAFRLHDQLQQQLRHHRGYLHGGRDAESLQRDDQHDSRHLQRHRPDQPDCLDLQPEQELLHLQLDAERRHAFRFGQPHRLFGPDLRLDGRDDGRDGDDDGGLGRDVDDQRQRDSRAAC